MPSITAKDRRQKKASGCDTGGICFWASDWQAARGDYGYCKDGVNGFLVTEKDAGGMARLNRQALER